MSNKRFTPYYFFLAGFFIVLMTPSHSAPAQAAKQTAYQLGKACLLEYESEEAKRAKELSKDSGGLFTSFSANPNSDSMPKKLACALKYANAAIQENPLNPDAYLLRSEIYENWHMGESSILDAHKAILLAPGSAHAYERRAGVWYTAGKGMKAERLGSCTDLAFKRKLLEISRLDFATAQHARTLEEALSDMNKAIALDPKQARFFSFRAKISEALHGSIQGQIADVTRAIALEPNNPRYYEERAYIWQREAVPDLNKSLSDSNKAVRLAPGNTDYRSLRAHFLLTLGKYDEWEADYAILDKSCSGGWYRTQKADGKYMQGKIEEAILLWGQNKDSNDLLKAANGCLRLGDSRRCINFCDRALSCAGSDEVRSHFLKAKALDKIGDVSAALTEGEIALKLAKAAPPWRMKYGPFFVPKVSVAIIDEFCKTLRQNRGPAPVIISRAGAFTGVQ